MDNNKACQTSLEHLPTEIFLQILAFFHLQELVTTFSGLNTYIDSMIRSVRTANHVVRFNDVNAIHLVHSFPIQIGRLSIVNVDTIDLAPLINLRSLTLKYGTEAQFDSIRPQNFPLLEILHIKGFHKTVTNSTEIMSRLFQVILSNGFRYLRICTTSEIGGSIAFAETWTGSSSLRALNLNMTTTFDADQLQSVCPLLRRFTTYESTMGNPRTAPIIGAKRRIMRELERLELLESENKFIIDINPLAFFGNKEIPSRFNNTPITSLPPGENLITFQGRIQPQSEPFCRASFLIEIRLANEYPFKAPFVALLDPIYHPHVRESDGHYRICNLDYDETYLPKTSISKIIEDILRIIDSNHDVNHLWNPDCYREYKNDYPTFYKKALECTLSYGRPRF